MHIKLIEKFSDSNNIILAIKVITMLISAAIEEVLFKIKTKTQTKTVIKNNVGFRNNHLENLKKKLDAKEKAK